MAADPTGRSRPSCGSRAEAERFIADFTVTLDGLADLLAEESAHLAAGRMREGLAQEGAKTELAGAYLRGLEHVKANAIALARFAPDALVRLRDGHERVRREVERNQAVVATAQAVSEGLVRSLMDEMGRAGRASGYGAARPATAVAARPLVLSTRA